MASELIQRGNPGYSKQQMQIRNSSSNTATTAPTPTNMPVSASSAARGVQSYGSGGAAQYGGNTPMAANTVTKQNREGSFSESFSGIKSPASSSDEARAQDNALGNDISGAMSDTGFTSSSDGYNKYVAMIDEQAKRLKGDYEDNVKLLNEQFDKSKTDLQASQGREQAITGAKLQRIGGYLGESGSAMGVTSNQIAQHRTELESLAIKRADALNAAKNAYTKEDIALAQSKMKEAKDYEETIYQRRKDFIAQTNQAAKDAAAAQKAREDQNNKIRDDARATVNTMLTSFGGFDFDNMDDATIQQVAELAQTAGYPLSALRGPTIAQTSQQSTERQRAISNAISEANLNLSRQRLANDMVITSSDASRLGLPKSLVGVDENTIQQQLKDGKNVPQWYLEHKFPNGVPAGVTSPILSEWNTFRNEAVKTGSSSGFQLNLGGMTNEDQAGTSYLEE